MPITTVKTWGDAREYTKQEYPSFIEHLKTLHTDGDDATANSAAINWNLAVAMAGTSRELGIPTKVLNPNAYPLYRRETVIDWEVLNAQG